MICNRCLRAAMLLVWSVVLATTSVAALADEPLVPLTELGSAKYRGEVGGLYGDGRNEPPAAQRRAGERSDRPDSAARCRGQAVRGRQDRAAVDRDVEHHAGVFGVRSAGRPGSSQAAGVGAGRRSAGWRGRGRVGGRARPAAPSEEQRSLDCGGRTSESRGRDTGPSAGGLDQASAGATGPIWRIPGSRRGARRRARKDRPQSAAGVSESANRVSFESDLRRLRDDWFESRAVCLRKCVCRSRSLIARQIGRQGGR